MDKVDSTDRLLPSSSLLPLPFLPPFLDSLISSLNNSSKLILPFLEMFSIFSRSRFPFLLDKIFRLLTTWITNKLNLELKSLFEEFFECIYIHMNCVIITLFRDSAFRFGLFIRKIRSIMCDCVSRAWYTRMEHQKKHFRHILFVYYRKGKNEKGYITIRQRRNCFSKFRSDNFDVKYVLCAKITRRMRRK